MRRPQSPDAVPTCACSRRATRMGVGPVAPTGPDVSSAEPGPGDPRGRGRALDPLDCTAPLLVLIVKLVTAVASRGGPSASFAEFPGGSGNGDERGNLCSVDVP
jgi:hypothetical protein